MKPNRILPPWFLPPAPGRLCSPEDGGSALNLKGGRGIVCVKRVSSAERLPSAKAGTVKEESGLKHCQFI